MRCQIGIKTRYFATFLSISLDKEIDYFEYQGQLYYFNKVNNFTNYYPYYVNALGLNGFRVVMNCFNHPVSMDYMLYTYQIEEYHLDSFINLSLQSINKTIEIIKIKECWCTILD